MGEHEWIFKWFFGVPLWGVPITLVPWVAFQLFRKRWLKAGVGTVAVAAAWGGALALYGYYGVGCIEGCVGRVIPQRELDSTVLYGLFGYAVILCLFFTWGGGASEA